MNYLNKQKIILVYQYYKVISDDETYKNKRQEEIDYCLNKNFENKYIDEIHLFLEEDFNMNFINNKYNITVKKNITGKIINFKDVFYYYNDNLDNNICILINSDIYLDNSIEIVKNINFDICKLFISLNRYEKNYDDMPALLNGLECNDADSKKCNAFLMPYQESIWSQDGWIWKNKISNIDDRFDFNLGTMGCDNHLNYLLNKIGYNILNCSKNICINHYDRLSIVTNDYGISKGNVSKNKKNNTVGRMDTFLFLENQSEIPNKYTYEIKNNISYKKPAKINKLLIKDSISAIDLKNSQIIASSCNSKYNPTFSKFEDIFNWEPDKNDVEPYIQFNFENIYDITVIDIMGKPVNLGDLTFGYVSTFKISYFNINNKWINDNTIYTGIETTNGNYIKKIFLEVPIKCLKIKIFPLKYVNTKSLKIKFYKIDYPNINIFKYLCDNTEYFKQFSETVVDYSNINNIFKNKDLKITEGISDLKYDKNMLNKKITEGICLFTYVMNRNKNIYNNISYWLKQSVDQIIIIDWNSKDDLKPFIDTLNDKRILYVKVLNEDFFIRTYAQNLAARLCKYDKIFKLDSDIILKEKFFENHKLNIGEFYVGEYRCGRNENEKFLHGSTYLYLNDYLKINGYNEYIQDYGWDDSDFTIRLLTTGLIKKVFDYNYLYHVPHDETARTTNLDKKTNSLLMTFTNKYCLQNIVWNNNYDLQQFKIHKVNNNYVLCNRIKGKEYCFDEKIYTEAQKKARNLLNSWNIKI